MPVMLHCAVSVPLLIRGADPCAIAAEERLRFVLSEVDARMSSNESAAELIKRFRSAPSHTHWGTRGLPCGYWSTSRSSASGRRHRTLTGCAVSECNVWTIRSTGSALSCAEYAECATYRQTCSAYRYSLLHK